MIRASTRDQALVREINLFIILNALRDHSPVSRAALAAVTGLNKTTVSRVLGGIAAVYHAILSQPFKKEVRPPTKNLAAVL